MQINTLVTDLDNTLYDWVKIWHRTFSTLLNGIERKTGLPREILINEAKTVHQKHGTTEYAFLIQEMPSVRAVYRDAGFLELIKVFQAEIDETRAARRSVMSLFDGVAETLLKIKNTGCRVIGFTESLGYYTNYRIRKLGLDGLLDYVYSPRDHEIPEGLSREAIRYYEDSFYQLNITKHRYTPKGVAKPNPVVLLQILKDVRAAHHGTIYVGDSLPKDIVMAQQAEIADVYAAYGDIVDREEYDLLRAVTRLTDKEVMAELKLREKQVKPSWILRNSFTELIELFEFRGL